MPKKIIMERLSKCERRLFSLVPCDGTKVTSKKLIDLYYAGMVPDNGRVIVTGLIRVVQRKLRSKWTDHPFILCTSDRAGPKPIDVWLELKVATEAEGLA